MAGAKGASREAAIARVFIDAHKDRDHDEWLVWTDEGTKDERYRQVYRGMVNGRLGDVEDNVQLDEHGDVTVPPTRYSITIPKQASRSGKALVFMWGEPVPAPRTSTEEQAGKLAEIKKRSAGRGYEFHMTYDIISGEITVWDETQAGVVCVTKYVAVAVASIEAYGREYLEP